jgi:WD40 repeat protein
MLGFDRIKVLAAVAIGAGLTVGAGTGLVITTRAAGQPPPGEKARAGVDRQGDPLPPGAVARLGTVRFRPGDNRPWQGLAFMPDGQSLVTAGDGHSIAFWETGTGRRLREISTGTLWIRGFALSREGRHIAVGGFGYEGAVSISAVRIYDAASGREVRALPRDARGMDHCPMAFSPDGKLLVSLDTEGALRIEEVATGAELLRQQFPRDNSAQLALSPDGTTLAIATGANTHKLYLWKWQTGAEPRELPVGRYEARVIRFSPDGKRLATLSDLDHTIRVWDAESGRLVQRLDPPEGDDANRSVGLEFTPDGKTLILLTQLRYWEGVVHFWDAATGRYQGRFDVGSQAYGLALSADSRLMAIGTSGSVRVWELASRMELAANDEAHLGYLGRIVVFASGQVATASDDHTVRLWDAATGQQRLKLTHDYWVRGIAVSPDGTRLASSSHDDTVRVWDAQTGREIYRLPGHGRMGGRRALGFTPDGRRLVSWGDDFYLRVWDVKTGKALLEHALRPSGVEVPDPDAGPGRDKAFFLVGEAVVAPDGKSFLLNIGQVAHLFDVETGREVRTLDMGYQVQSLAVSPDGRLMLAGGWGKPVETKLPDGRVRHPRAEEHPLGLWDLASGQKVREVTLPGSISGPVAFAADGQTYACASDKTEGQIRLWETATGKELPAVTGVRGRVTALAFAPDGRFLVAGMEDTSALVWDLTGKR